VGFLQVYAGRLNQCGHGNKLMCKVF